MIKYSFDESELTSEKSLWDVYKQSRKILPSKLQFFTVLGSMCSGLIIPDTILGGTVATMT